MQANISKRLNLVQPNSELDDMVLFVNFIC